MAGHDQVSLPLHSQPEGGRVTQVIKVKSLHEVESRIKAAIWKASGSSEYPLEIKVAPSLFTTREYTMELVFGATKHVASQKIENKSIAQRMWLEEFESVSTVPFYQTPKDNLLPVEVLEASVQSLSLPAVIKLYHCKGFPNVNKVIQEALLQARVSSAYACKLLNLYISRDSMELLEVRLMMERLEGDLKADIEHRAQQDNHYSEGELKYILKCVAEAKLRVKST